MKSIMKKLFLSSVFALFSVFAIEAVVLSQHSFHHSLQAGSQVTLKKQVAVQSDETVCQLCLQIHSTGKSFVQPESVVSYFQNESKQVFFRTVEPDLISAQTTRARAPPIA